MRLADAVYEAVRRAGIEVYRADRGMTKFWNDERTRGELRYFCGHYWHERGKGKEHGPFPTKSAAYRNAYETLQLRLVKPVTTVRGGFNVIQMPKKATQSQAGRIAERDARALSRRLRRMGAA